MKELVLAPSENIVKKYTYVRHKKSAKKILSESSLIVTNKRVVKETISDKAVSRQEIPVGAIDFVDCSVKNQKRSLKKTVISSILALLFLVAGVVFNFITPIQGIDPMIPCYVCYGFGLISILLTISFFVIWCKSSGCSVDVVLLSYKKKNALFGASIKDDYEVIKEPKLKMEIDRDVADLMVDELSAIIFSVKGGV